MSQLYGDNVTGKGEWFPEGRKRVMTSQEVTSQAKGITSQVMSRKWDGAGWCGEWGWCINGRELGGEIKLWNLIARDVRKISAFAAMTSREISGCRVKCRRRSYCRLRFLLSLLGTVSITVTRHGPNARYTYHVYLPFLLLICIAILFPLMRLHFASLFHQLFLLY